MSETPIGDAVLASMAKLVRDTENVARIKMKLQLADWLSKRLDTVKTKSELKLIDDLRKELEAL